MTTVTAPHDHKTPGDGPITVMTIWEGPAEQVGEFIAQWRVRAGIMAAAPGFRDAKLHRAVSAQARFQLVNVAHWDSQAHLDAAHDNDEFRHLVRALREDPEMQLTGTPGVYEVAVVLDGE
jgi:heme oxygenase (mycobilin-producing)